MRVVAGMRRALTAAGWVLAALSAVAVVPSAAQPPAPGDASKPVAPFSIEAEALAAPAVGVPVDVRVTVSTRAELEALEVRISADAGLSVDAAGLTLYAPEAKPGAPAEWRITVVPLEPGVHRLRLFGEALVGGVRQGRSAVAALRVADAAGGEPGVESARGDSTVQGAEPAEGDDRGRKPARDRDGEAARPGTGDAESEPEPVIRLPAVVRP